MTVSSVKSTDVTYYTNFGQLAAKLPWLVNLVPLVCDVNWWLSCRVSALQSVVAGSSSRGGDHSIHCWWDLLGRNSCPVFPYVECKCSPDFLFMVIQFRVLLRSTRILRRDIETWGDLLSHILQWKTIRSKITITRKQRWEEKQLYGYFKQQTNEIVHEKNKVWLWKGNF